MWKCPDCNYIMEEDLLSCINCGCKKPESKVFKSTVNQVASLIKKIAIIEIVFGIIIGFILANTEYEFNWSNAIINWIESIVKGTLLYGFGEVIQILHNIKEHMNWQIHIKK